MSKKQQLLTLINQVYHGVYADFKEGKFEEISESEIEECDIPERLAKQLGGKVLNQVQKWSLPTYQHLDVFAPHENRDGFHLFFSFEGEQFILGTRNFFNADDDGYYLNSFVDYEHFYRASELLTLEEYNQKLYKAIQQQLQVYAELEAFRKNNT